MLPSKVRRNHPGPEHALPVLYIEAEGRAELWAVKTLAGRRVDACPSPTGKPEGRTFYNIDSHPSFPQISPSVARWSVWASIQFLQGPLS